MVAATQVPLFVRNTMAANFRRLEHERRTEHAVAQARTQGAPWKPYVIIYRDLCPFALQRFVLVLDFALLEALAGPLPSVNL
jgi:hypothetical protein